MKLPAAACGVPVLWEWEWLSDTGLFEPLKNQEDTVCSNTDSETQSQSGTCGSSDEETQVSFPLTHTITFKCIGATRSSEAQDSLKMVNELNRAGKEVPVNIFCEPDNPYDSKAIAFRCKIEQKWYTIGYIVREALPYVHEAIHKRNIVSVRFSWVKYLVSWTRSGPGYYAGIDITVKGRWPYPVIQCSSTK